MKNLFFLLFSTVMMFGQEIELATNGSRRFSFDKFTADIYWEDLTTNTVIFKTNLITNQIDKINFPIFANNSHFASFHIIAKKTIEGYHLFLKILI